MVEAEQWQTKMKLERTLWSQRDEPRERGAMVESMSQKAEVDSWIQRAEVEQEGWNFATTIMKTTVDLGDQEVMPVELEGWREPGD